MLLISNPYVSKKEFVFVAKSSRHYKLEVGKLKVCFIIS